MKWVKGVSCTVTDENWTFYSDHFVVYTNMDLLCCKPETKEMLYTGFTPPK